MACPVNVLMVHKASGRVGSNAVQVPYSVPPRNASPPIGKPLTPELVPGSNAVPLLLIDGLMVRIWPPCGLELASPLDANRVCPSPASPLTSGTPIAPCEVACPVLVSIVTSSVSLPLATVPKSVACAGESSAQTTSDTLAASRPPFVIASPSIVAPVLCPPQPRLTVCTSNSQIRRAARNDSTRGERQRDCR